MDAVICTVLRVSGKEVDTWCAEQAQTLPKDRPIIWVRNLAHIECIHSFPCQAAAFAEHTLVLHSLQVHFGVDVKGEHCKLEVCTRKLAQPVKSVTMALELKEDKQALMTATASSFAHRCRHTMRQHSESSTQMAGNHVKSQLTLQMVVQLKHASEQGYQLQKC